MSSDVKFVEGRGGVGGRHDAELVKDFLQSREAAVLQESTKQCCREGGRRQRPKNPYSKLALLSGKFLRVRKNFAHMRK